MNKFKNKLFTKKNVRVLSKNVQVLSKNEQLKINGGGNGMTFEQMVHK